jgi:5-methylcytosine-specific restriction protein B
MSQQQWESFMTFGALFAKSVDLAAEEYDYKVALALRLKTTREAYLAGDSDWFAMLRKDISSTNLMNQYFMMRLVDLGRTRTEELRRIIDILWRGDPDVKLIDDFNERLRPYNPEQFSVGGVIGFASILLLGRDPQTFPPYRARAVKKFLKLVGWEDRGANGSPSRRYELLLEALDEMLRLAPDFGIQLRDRLDAQGLMWTVTNVDPSAEWDAKQRKMLQQWRGTKWMFRERFNSRSLRRLLLSKLLQARLSPPGCCSSHLRLEVVKQLGLWITRRNYCAACLITMTPVRARS